MYTNETLLQMHDSMRNKPRWYHKSPPTPYAFCLTLEQCVGNHNQSSITTV